MVATESYKQLCLHTQVRDLLEEAKAAEEGDRRIEQRHPYFRPVSIALGGATPTLLSAFSLGISRNGIGLLHSSMLPLGPVNLVVKPESGILTNLPGEVMWCQAVGEGWFISGVNFTFS